MPVPKQTTDLTFALRALLYRIRQLTRERQGYSKAKHRELAKLLKEGREEFARIKTEDVIANDNLIAALEIVELHCEQLHVRVNILDHLAFSQKRKPVRRKQKDAGGRKSTGSATKRHNERDVNTSGGSGGGWGIWSLFGSSSPAPQPDKARTPHPVDTPAAEDSNTASPRQSEETKNDDATDGSSEDETYIDPELDRAAAVIFYSYARIPRDIPGLLEVKVKLAQRWGNDFANRMQDDDDPPVKLPEELVRRLRLQKAPESLVESYLKEIARSHGIPYGDEDSDSDGEEGGLQVQGKQSNDPVKVSGEEKGEKANNTEASGETENKGGGIPEMDELARRFAALKK